MRLEGWNESVPGSILRDGRASKPAVADFATLRLPKSGKPDFGARPPQDEVLWVSPGGEFLTLAAEKALRLGRNSIPIELEPAAAMPWRAARHRKSGAAFVAPSG